MDRTFFAALTIGFLVLVLVLMLIGWRSRRRRQSQLGQPVSVPADLGTVLLDTPLLYVGSSYAGDPLNRVTTGALGFRAKANLTVAETGLVLGIPGQADTFIPRRALTGVGRGTWTIDRVVEPDGLLVISHLLGDTEIDSYARLTGLLPIDEVVGIISALIPEVTGSESE